MAGRATHHGMMPEAFWWALAILALAAALLLGSGPAPHQMPDSGAHRSAPVDTRGWRPTGSFAY